MISILICSINEVLKRNLIKNIKETIGTAFEILIHDNIANKKSISSVYNQLKEKANGDFICFLHEDVIFNTKNWGVKIIDAINSDASIGMIGIAGSKYKSRIPSSWGCINKKHLVLHYIQGQKYYEGKKVTPIYENDTNPATNVVCIDGVLMFITKDVCSKIQFDESIIKGFHGYDLDLSMQVLNQGRKIIVSNQVLVTHLSEGTPNIDWYNTHKQLSKKWEKNLPIKINQINLIELVSNEYNCFYSGLFPLKNKNRLLMIKHFWNYFSIHFLWFFLYKHLIKKWKTH